MRIALDAGHGFKDGKPTGARGCGLCEDTLAWTLVQKLRWYLLKAGWEVVLTRPTQALAALGARGSLAKAKRCDVFVSVHINAASDPHASGAEVLVAESDARSAMLAGRLLDALVESGLKRRGVKWDSQSRHARLRVLRDTYRAMPAVLLEVGFITNSADAVKLGDPKWLDETAARMAGAISKWNPAQ